MGSTPPNSGSLTTNVGGQAVAIDKETPCKELDNKNKAERQALANDPSKSISGNFGPGGATTVAHGSMNGGAALGAASRLLPQRFKHLAEGLWANTSKTQRRQMRKTGRSNVCPGAPFTYQKSARPHQSHCESKILESMFSNGAKPTGNLLLNINWQSMDNPNSKVPCAACKRLLCHAQKNCDIKVHLCTKDPDAPPAPLKC